MEPTIRLVPLRVPAGWAVRWNLFLEADPPVDGRHDSEWPEGDLLCIEQVRPDGDDAPAWWLGLSWVERDGGFYRLVLCRDGTDRVFKRFIARDREEMRITLETWLDALSSARRESTLLLRL